MDSVNLLYARALPDQFVNQTRPDKGTEIETSNQAQVEDCRSRHLVETR